MSTVVLKMNQEDLQKMKEYYDHFLVAKIPNGAFFQARPSNSVITAYHSGKVVFQGNNCKKEARKWGEIENESLMEKKNGPLDYRLKSILTNAHIGSDETGTGDYFGPVVVCALFVEKDHIPLLKQMGIQDSKKITDERVFILTEEILQMNLTYSLFTLPNELYNKKQASGWNQNKIKTILHHHAHKNVIKKLKSQRKFKGIIVDQFSPVSNYEKHLQSENEYLLDDTYFLTKAEDHSIAVAAASIIARARFVQEINQLSERLTIEIPKGASNKVDKSIAKIIKKYGKEELSKIGKLHFANTEKAKRYL